jgi:hypothetical protein
MREMDTGPGRDLYGELVAAIREAALRLRNYHRWNTAGLTN